METPFSTPRPRHGWCLTRELAAFDTRVPKTIVTSVAGGSVAFEDVPIRTVGVDRLVAAEQTQHSGFVAGTFGGNAGLF